jgi:hypothetical protein
MILTNKYALASLIVCANRSKAHRKAPKASKITQGGQTSVCITEICLSYMLIY